MESSASSPSSNDLLELKQPLVLLPDAVTTPNGGGGSHPRRSSVCKKTRKKKPLLSVVHPPSGANVSPVLKADGDALLPTKTIIVAPTTTTSSSSQGFFFQNYNQKHHQKIFSSKFIHHGSKLHCSVFNSFTMKHEWYLSR